MTPHNQEVSHAKKTCKRGHAYIYTEVQCPICRVAGHKAWCERNSEYVKRKQRKYYEENKEKIKAQARKWAGDHHEQRLASARRYVENKEQITQKRRELLRRYPEYGVWANMLTRCTNPKTGQYKDYGGRGITVCERWKVFDNFYEDMGSRPTPKHTIERLDNDKGHGRVTVLGDKRAARRNTKRNRILELNGKSQCMQDWANELGITAQLLWNRLYLRNWPLERALTGLERRKP